MVSSLNTKMVWINEGFVLDDHNTLIYTVYVDLRREGDRLPFPALVKGCKREHALEDGSHVLISQPGRFRKYGEKLIKDVQEGFAKEEHVTLTKESSAELKRRKTVDDLNAARELVGSRVRMEHKENSSGRSTSSKSIEHSEGLWIFCTSIEPSQEDWETWRATLPEEYDHVSVIGQPAKFAQALARMVAEQVGPQGKDGTLMDTTESAEGPKTKHNIQCVIHGPVVYTDQVYESLARDLDGRERLAVQTFTKSTKYAAQREYRFAVLNGGDAEETVKLSISGMMRDALTRTDPGLIRISPAQSDTSDDNDVHSPSPNDGNLKLIDGRRTITERVMEREERRSETRTEDGQLLSSEGKRRERVKERIETQELRQDDDESNTMFSKIGDDVVPTEKQNAQDLSNEAQDEDVKSSEEEAVRELALAEREWIDDSQQDTLRIPVVHRGSGRSYKSLKEAFSDPAFPTNPTVKSWQEKACTVEEITQAYAAVDSLDWKIRYVSEEHRQDVASAAWYAMQCIRNIYARLGNVVDSVWIERDRFVVIRLKNSEGLDATGRIVIAPSGAYSYCLKLSDRETSGNGGIEWHPMFFPIGDQVDAFESYGWPPKTS